jgi:hypothetical protein
MCVQCNGLQLVSGLAQSLFYGLQLGMFQTLEILETAPDTLQRNVFNENTQVSFSLCIRDVAKTHLLGKPSYPDARSCFLQAELRD